MKTLNQMLWTAIVPITLLCACGNAPKQDSTPIKKETTKVNIQTRNLPCNREFIQIINLGSADIVYTQGEYQIDATGDSTLLDMLQLSFDSGTLTINMNGEAQSDITPIATMRNVKIQISSPQLNYLTSCGSGAFQSVGTISTDNFQVSITGMGAMQLDTIQCDKFKMENNYAGQAELAYLKCHTAVITAFGNSTTTANITAEEEVNVLTGTNGKADINAKTNKIIINSSDKCNGTYNVNCQTLSAYATDLADITLNGIAKNVKTKSAIGSKITNKLTKR